MLNTKLGRSRWTSITAGVIGVLIVGGFAANAAVKTPPTTVNFCVDKKKFTVTKKVTCTAKETSLVMNQQGVAGTDGSDGVDGADGTNSIPNAGYTRINQPTWTSVSMDGWTNLPTYPIDPSVAHLVTLTFAYSTNVVSGGNATIQCGSSTFSAESSNGILKEVVARDGITRFSQLTFVLPSGTSQIDAACDVDSSDFQVLYGPVAVVPIDSVYNIAPNP